ncbi:MAG: ribosome recycling factor [Victivallales bacterium]|nr:ribosome recycling factor [Victivallales bacterium]
MSESIDNLLETLEEHMMKTIDAMHHDFSAVRTGKASPALVENITVDYYGTPTRLRELAGITVPEAKMLMIQPWDPSVVSAIEKAILASNIGISPVSDGRVLRLPIPELSEERRHDLTKQVKGRSEDAKIAIRNIRRDGNDAAKKAQKGGELTEDELKQRLDEIQKLTDDYVTQVDKILAEKEKDLMNI